VLLEEKGDSFLKGDAPIFYIKMVRFLCKGAIIAFELDEKLAEFATIFSISVQFL